MSGVDPAPFSLRIFVADGDPDGLRIVDKSNWIGRRWYSRARCCRRSRPGPSWRKPGCTC